MKLAAKKASIEKKAEKEAKALLAKENKGKVTASKQRAKKEESDDETPKKAKRKSGGATSSATTTKKKSAVEKEESDSDVPLAKTALTKKSKVKKVNSDSDVPLSRSASSKKVNGKVKAEPSTPSKKEVKAKKEASEEAEEEEGEEYRWWDAPKKEDDSIKWTTLEHNGVVFPPEYEPLPKHIKLRYDGVPVNLHKDAEEVAGFFGAMLNSTHNVENPTFQKNFFNDFTEVLKKTGGATDRNGNKVQIKEFSKLDFQPIFEYYHAKNEEKKGTTSRGKEGR